MEVKKFIYSLLVMSLKTKYISTIWVVDYLYFIPILSIFELFCGGHFVLLENTGTFGENHWSATSNTNFYHIRLYQVHLTVNRNLIHKCIFRYNSNYHAHTCMQEEGWGNIWGFHSPTKGILKSRFCFKYNYDS